MENFQQTPTETMLKLTELLELETKTALYYEMLCSVKEKVNPNFKFSISQTLSKKLRKNFYENEMLFSILSFLVALMLSLFVAYPINSIDALCLRLFTFLVSVVTVYYLSMIVISILQTIHELKLSRDLSPQELLLIKQAVIDVEIKRTSLELMVLKAVIKTHFEKFNRQSKQPDTKMINEMVRMNINICKKLNSMLYPTIGDVKLHREIVHTIAHLKKHKLALRRIAG